MRTQESSLPNINDFYIGQRIPSLYSGNNGFKVTDIDKKKCILTVKQDGTQITQTIHLSEIVKSKC
jgi:hypothetical protein